MLGLLTVSLQVSSEQPAVGDEAATGFPLFAGVSSQPVIEIAGGIGEGVDKGLGVKRCLCDTCRHMRPGNEGGITE